MSSLTPSNNALIAGQACGIRIRATPQAKAVFDKLAAQAKTNYWAHGIVHGIQALCSGRMHLNNVFIKQQDIPNNNSEFHVVLPGCTATLEKTANGECRLLYMRADENYFKQQEKGNEPGLHAITKEGEDGWKAKFNANGKITNTPRRFVAITDRHANSVPKTIAAAWDTLSDNPLRSSDDLAMGFDAHYTPGTTRIGGLKNVRQAVHAGNDPELHASAILLARTMYEARDIKRVLWVSETGGSGVLTQALQILVNQGVDLKKSEHSIFLCNPTTRVSTIQALSIQLGLGQPRRINRSNPLKPDELVGGLGFGGGYVTAGVRFRHDKNYGVLKLVGDVFNETTSLNGAIGVAGNVASGVGLTASAAAAVGLTAGGIAMPAVLTFAAAVLPTVGLGKTLIENYLPRIYKKMTGKF